MDIRIADIFCVAYVKEVSGVLIWVGFTNLQTKQVLF